MDRRSFRLAPALKVEVPTGLLILEATSSLEMEFPTWVWVGEGYFRRCRPEWQVGDGSRVELPIYLRPGEATSIGRSRK
jgi:hypothetical protein